MRNFISIYFGVLAIAGYAVGFYILNSQPFTGNTNSVIFLSIFALSGFSTLIFLKTDPRNKIA